jgi:predicted Zn-dependent protease
MGRESDQSVVQTFGLYPDDELQEYIQELGSRLAADSERPDLPWTFRVVDDPLVNAFAIPGGYIYITRGILAHFNSEAELVSVLGHEIGHVTARHSVEQMSQAQLAQLGLGVAMAAGERYRQYLGIAAQGLQLMFLKFSRDDEKQADDLGLRYMTRVGYDPYQMPKVFNTLDRVGEAQGGGSVPEWTSTHPNPDRRAERITKQVERLPPESRTGTVNRESYLERLDGMVFGDNPREGYTVGSDFYHPDLKFRLSFPDGWKIINQRQAVAGVSPNEDAVVVLSLSREPTVAAAAEDFFSRNGLEMGSEWRPGFFHFLASATPEQPQPMRGVAGFVAYDGRVYQILSYTPQERWQGYHQTMMASVESFSGVRDRRYLDVQPARIEIVELERDMSFEEFRRRYPSNADDTALAIINGVEPGDTLEEGRLMKRIVGGDVPKE